MFFGYPTAATNENWLHDCLVGAINELHSHVDTGTNVPKWPGVIPLAYQAKLKAYWKFKELLLSYKVVIEGLSQPDRDLLLQTLTAQNATSNLLQCQQNCLRLTELPAAAQTVIGELATYSFGLLTKFRVRHRQYAAIHQNLNSKICPFCGSGHFDAPPAPQEDFDHYMPRSIYSFSATNLKNLAPMCGKCNSTYKRDRDVLRSNAGARRAAFDPYVKREIGVDLSNSEVGVGLDSPLVANWVVDFFPASDEVETWDAVFNIRTRVRRDVLEKDTVDSWLQAFTFWCQSLKSAIASDAELVAAINDYALYFEKQKCGDRAMYKAAVFRFIGLKAQGGCDRILGVMRDCAGMSQPGAMKPLFSKMPKI